MADQVLLKKSSVAAKVPLTTDLDYGEPAINYADGRLYYKTASNTIDYISGKGTVTSVAVSVPSFLSVSGSPITSSGTIAISLSGTALPVANGGTGATSSSAALTSLGAQATLVSGTNIKTINGTSVLGSGDLAVSGTAVIDDVQVISTNTTAVRFKQYTITASLTLTLPATPSAGDWVEVIARSGTYTVVVGRNSSNIEAKAENMTLNKRRYRLRFTYINSTIGWQLTRA